MHILILSDNFPPEVNAAANRVYERACYWVDWGHQVTVITSAPNFPQGKIYHGYKNKWWQQEIMHGITVIRVKTFMAPNRGFFLRTLDFFSYMCMAGLMGMHQPKPDIIIATSPQIFTAIAGWWLAKIKKTPWLLELSDLWPASIAAVGAIKNKKILCWLEKLELLLYRKASTIVALTQSFKNNLIQRGITPDKINVVLNGVDLNHFSPCNKNLMLLKKFDLLDKFVVGYIGTHGMAHNLINILHAARALQNSNIHFIFIGDGAEKNTLIETAKEWQLQNVTFFPQMPRKQIVDYWSMCDVTLIHLKNHPTFAEVIPSKIMEAIAMCIPIVACVPPGEASAIVASEGCGICIDAENYSTLEKTLLELQENPHELINMQSRAQAIRHHYSREKQASEYLQSIENYHLNCLK